MFVLCEFKMYSPSGVLYKQDTLYAEYHLTDSCEYSHHSQLMAILLIDTDHVSFLFHVLTYTVKIFNFICEI